MIRVVIDANQFVSSLLKPDSNPARLLSLAREGKIHLIMSSAIIDEIRAVLLSQKIMKRHRRTSAQLDLFLKKLLKVAVITQDGPKLDVIVDDPPGNKYLECAVAGRADFIISGDRHLTDLKLFQGIRIMSPAHFRETFAG
jgi:putative PIN family toxin of toxin-antitoxin system